MPGASMLFFFVFVLSACVALAVALIAWRRGVRPLALEPRARDLVFDSLDEAVMVLDLQTHIVDINPAALSMLGLSTPPIGQLALLVLSAWQEQLSPYRSWPKAELELTFTMPDQTLHYFEVRIFPMRDRRGQLSGRVVMARDVTDRHAAELRMRQLERVVEQSPASVVITDTSGRIEYVNPTFTRLTGYRLDEALGQNPNILKTGHTSPEEYAQMWQIISSGHEWRGEFLNRKKNGDLYWEEAHIAPVLDTTGRLTHYVAVKEDITVRKRIEEDLRASRARLKAIFDNASAGITLGVVKK